MSILIFTGHASGQVVAGKNAVGQSRAVVHYAEVARRQAALPHSEPAAPISIEEGEPPAPFPVPPEVAAAAAAKAKFAPRLALQASAAQAPSPAPSVSFAGLRGMSFDGYWWIPADTQAAVGPNHLMVTLNNGVLIQTRTGSTAKPGIGLSAFWGRSPDNGNYAIDPRVLYDPFLDRWIFVSIAALYKTNSVLYIAMSQTNDPTGTWTTYSFPADQTAFGNSTTPTLWGDFPSVGFNKTWVVVTLNMYTISTNTYSKGTIFAFDINGLMTGASTLHAAVFDDTNGGFTLSPAVTLDNNLTTMYLVQRWNGNSSGSGYLRINTITGAVGSESYTKGPFASTPNPWAMAPPTDNFAPQLNSDANHLIDSDDDRMHDVVYRNGSLWAVQTVFLPATGVTRSAIQWWQLSTTGTVQQVGRIDDSTAVNFYAYPSIAVNRQNDVLLGFSHFSASIFAEAAYAFAPFNTGINAVQPPFTYKTGEAFYYVLLGTRNRWGDYSATRVDPVNDLDFWTLQEYASSINLCATCTGGWGTWWANLAVPTAKKRLFQVTSD